MSRPSKRSRWQAYVDDALLKTGQVTDAAIHGLDGARWASSPGLQVGMEQVTKIVDGLMNDEAQIRRNGILVGDQHYIYLRREEGRGMYGRKSADAGICILKTRKAVLVVTYSAGIQPSNCTAVVEKLRDYLVQHDL